MCVYILNKCACVCVYVRMHKYREREEMDIIYIYIHYTCIDMRVVENPLTEMTIVYHLSTQVFFCTSPYIYCKDYDVNV